MKFTADDMQNKEMIKESIRTKLMNNFGITLDEASNNQIYRVVAMTVRDAIIENWVSSRKKVEKTDAKQLYYLSIEFLVGRVLRENMMNMLREDIFSDACNDLGIDIARIAGVEREAGLGNGGLGRLAACIMDSLTTSGLPAIGCGIRYQYGLFKQNIIDGYQVEVPDPWLDGGNIWEIVRPEQQEEIRFGGVIDRQWQGDKLIVRHRDYDTVFAVPYDIPVMGYSSALVNTLRLWRAKASNDLNMEWFIKGDYVKAIEEKEKDENISRVLYPDDVHFQGKILRLKQYYFFVSATIQNIVHNFKKKHADLKCLPDKVAIHINDTHPAVAIPELMRVLMDQEGLKWEDAWSITVKSFAYTNHTVMQEALEKWPVPLFKDLLPRIYDIVHEINERYCNMLWQQYPGESDRISRMAIIAYEEIRMANLCIAGSHSINGVSALHTHILKDEVFKDFYQVHPERFYSITNGVTHRRWLFYANPGLSDIIRQTIGDGWILNSDELSKLKEYAGDPAFRDSFQKVKRANKERLAAHIFENQGIKVNPESIFDVQIKRIHEYKRQLLNLLHIMYLYNRVLDEPEYQIHPRTFIFGGKAAPSYRMAKLTIKLIHSIADEINGDPRMQDRIKVIFMEDYRVSLAELIIPAAEVSQQISTAGKEASGTGNMKLMLNGALTVGTWDGANIEMCRAAGEENMFLFGMKTEDIREFYKHGNNYNPRQFYEGNLGLKSVLDQLISGLLSKDNPMLFADIFYSLVNGDPYMVLGDFESYRKIQHKVDVEYGKADIWLKKAIINVAAAGKFSSDVTVGEYNKMIWKLVP